MHIDGNGDLVLETAAGSLTQHRPLLYQQIKGTQHDIAGGFHLLGDGRVVFDVGAYDATLTIVIDPVIAYSTFLGGSGTTGGGETVNGVAVDTSGNTYLAGITQSADFPVTTQLGPRNTAANAFVVKLNPSGSGIVWSTVFGGSSTGGDNAEAVALDPSGNVWVTGWTSATDFPTTATAFKPVRTCAQTPCHDTNAFVTEFNPTGTIPLYSTYLGGQGGTVGSNTQTDAGWYIAVDSAGKAYVAGSTSSPDFPTTTGAWQTSGPASFLSKFDASQTAPHHWWTRRSSAQPA